MSVEKLVEEKKKLKLKRIKKERQLTVLEQEIKAKACLTSEEQRKKRTHRLCVYGGVVEKYILPELYSEQETVQLLDQIFNLQDVQNIVKDTQIP